MWDVIWTDPDKELVGEHRARKEKRETPQKEPKSRPRRRSASTASSRWSTDSPFAIFRNRGAKKTNTSSSDAQMMSPASSGLESPALLSPDRSPVAKMFDQGSRRSSSRISTSFLDRLVSIDSPLNTSPLIPETSARLPLHLASDDDSLVPVDRVSNDDLTESEKMKSLMQIFGQSPQTAKPAAVAPDTSVNRPLTPPLTADNLKTSPSYSSTSSPTAKPPSGSPVAPIPSTNPLQMEELGTEMAITPNNPEAWRPLDDWEPRPLLEESPEPTFEPGDPNQLPKDGIGINKNFCWLRAAVVEMADTNVPEILSRLETIWKGVAKKDVAFLLGDSPEVEELRRWMLSTMIHMDKVPTTDGQWLPRRVSPLTARMTISLYDSAATVAYLAALEPTKQIYHVSQLSIPRDELFANVRVISVSQVSPTDFPVAPRIYESVHSLTLPSLCPAAQLPGILGNVYKCLKKKGFLRLVIIDPLPRAGTMGRNMKAWLEEHLLRNLAKQGKCLSPSTAFPPLLAEARLRGEGSTLTTTKFYAVPESATEYLDKVKDAIQAENEEKAQVRSLIGRMLWAEAWGRHVTGNKWWWDDPACVAECLEMGTFWEYHTVKGVKEVDEASKAA
ncbi:hypothetical protein BBK36DRAFT_1182202 [Trichoderma citrinoviride]|uniref:Uncharacterized protein n=1 Tax=Trichoderma citrinoviride TaxID=58853 RepID=A0A2T4B2I2_9HYPO|nr:hypothetical protein BBK36DRAFT_1182202 [Trichoderma citrinoviride]PTB63529.1 hypothetical protein BBK36DRAFT_1182202 [Trichoderma citrinoviride]